MSVLPPLYQLAQSPRGTWRVRVFNLPAQGEGLEPTLPFLLALAPRPGAGPSPWARDWQKDPAEQLTVLRLAGAQQGPLDALLALLRTHGIARAAAFAPKPAAPP